jgi:arabinogalactan endo-1,4-beta-galactosidase
MPSLLSWAVPALFSAFTCSVSALQYAGADFSSLITLERNGISYSDGGSTQAFETILTNHGSNVARIRIWTGSSGDYTLDYSLELAQRAAAAGMEIMVDFHYSDTCEKRFAERITSTSTDFLYQGLTQASKEYQAAGQRISTA